MSADLPPAHGRMPTTDLCQCGRANRPCTRPITQEDLLCDICRPSDGGGWPSGCESIFFASKALHHVKVRIDFGAATTGSDSLPARLEM